MADVRAIRPASLAAVIDLAMQRHQLTTGRALSRKSRDLGIELSYTFLNEVRRSAYPHPLRAEQRERLAKLAGVPQRVVDDLAGAPDLAPFRLPERAAELSGDQRKAVLAVVGAFISANEALAQAQRATILAEAAMEDRRPGEVQLPPPGASEEPDT